MPSYNPFTLSLCERERKKKTMKRREKTIKTENIRMIEWEWQQTADTQQYTYYMKGKLLPYFYAYIAVESIRLNSVCHCRAELAKWRDEQIVLQKKKINIGIFLKIGCLRSRFLFCSFFVRFRFFYYRRHFAHALLHWMLLSVSKDCVLFHFTIIKRAHTLWTACN